MKKVFQMREQGKMKEVGRRALATVPGTASIESQVALIQALILLGLQVVADALVEEVVALAGTRYSRVGGRAGVVRWGRQSGSVYLADQKHAITYPRVRDLAQHTEVPLITYQRLQEPRAADTGLFRKVLLGLICRNYEACAEAVPGAFGLRPSTISRRFIRASARHLRTLSERRLEGEELVAVVLDGKTFAHDAMVIALGITLQGQKTILGFVQTATENERGVCRLPAGVGRAGAAGRVGPPLYHRRRQGAPQGAPDRLRHPSRGATLPVAQTGKRGQLPAQDPAGHLAAQAAGGVRAAHL